MSRTVLLHARGSMAIVERTTVCYAGYATFKQMDLSHTSAEMSTVLVGDREITPTLTLFIVPTNGQSSFCSRMAVTKVVSNERSRYFLFYEHACTFVSVSLEYLVWYCLFCFVGCRTSVI